jgi:protein-tyrosine-phosphatase
MESRTSGLIKLLHSLWREVIGGIIAIGVVAALGHFYSNQTAEILALVVGLLAVFGIVVWQLSRRSHKVLVYVSSGSTCRDPMAKAITDRLLVGRPLKHPVDVYAVGLVPSGAEPSYGARETIRRKYGADLLKDHKPTAFTDELVNKADLILVMDKKLFDATKDTLPPNKTHLLKQFFGENGDVANPWRQTGERDPQTMMRYEACFDELNKILSAHMDTLLKALGAV